VPGRTIAIGRIHVQSPPVADQPGGLPARFRHL